jgi:hypothetical protein
MSSGHSLSITFKEIIYVKSETFQFPKCVDFTHFHNFFTKTYYLKCLKSTPGHSLAFS